MPESVDDCGLSTVGEPTCRGAAEVVSRRTRFKPNSAFLGALKVADDVVIGVEFLLNPRDPAMVTPTTGVGFPRGVRTRHATAPLISTKDTVDHCGIVGWVMD